MADTFMEMKVYKAAYLLHDGLINELYGAALDYHAAAEAIKAANARYNDMIAAEKEPKASWVPEYDLGPEDEPCPAERIFLEQKGVELAPDDDPYLLYHAITQLESELTKLAKEQFFGKRTEAEIRALYSVLRASQMPRLTLFDVIDVSASDAFDHLPEDVQKEIERNTEYY